MKMLGTGIISGCGRGIECHKAASVSSNRVAPEVLKDKTVLKNMRRADRFCKMAAIAAHDAVSISGIELKEGDGSVGIILTTALGPHNTTFKFLDDILDFGDAEVSPTKFSHSVHNVAAFYVASAIGSRGPTTTVTNFNDPFADGLALARAWLDQGRSSYVLVGYVEEISEPFEYINNKLLAHDDEAPLQKFSLSLSPDAVFSEGAVFVLLSGEQGTCDIEGIQDISSLIAAAGE